MGFLKRLFGKSAPEPQTDPARRAAIWRQVLEQGWTPDAGEEATVPVVSVDDFFTGNDDTGSIACNVAGMPGEPDHATFRATLTALASRPGVRVLLALDPEDDRESWPTCNMVFVLADATEDQVRAWTADLKPDDITEGYACEPARRPPDEPSVRVWTLFWD